jgi:hypothetical protein
MLNKTRQCKPSAISGMRDEDHGKTGALEGLQRLARNGYLPVLRNIAFRVGVLQI